MARTPTITCTVKDTNPKTVALTGDDSVIVRSYSNAYVKMYPVAYDGESINLDTCLIRNGVKKSNGTLYPSTIYGTEGTFSGRTLQGGIFHCQAEDSKGNVGECTKTCEFIDYISLTCNAAKSKPDGSGRMSLVCYGDCFNGDFGKQKNVIQCEYQVTKPGGGNVLFSGEMTVGLTGNSYVASATVYGLDYEAAYDITFIARDLLESRASGLDGVTGMPVFHWGREDFVFEVPVAFNAGVTSSEGRATSFPECGEWTPELESANASYSTRRGWYIKAGNIVTVGFYVKAICYPEDTTTTILIMGVPYEPLYHASGGGICSGALMYTNKNFQCYAIDTNGFITTRAQDCGETNNTNLATSSAACRYPSGKELTVSGTITYMIYE